MFRALKKLVNVNEKYQKMIKRLFAIGLAALTFVAVAEEKKECAKCDESKECAKCDEKADAKKVAAKKKMASVSYAVKGLSCGACEKKLTTALGKLEGVAEPGACSKSNSAKLTFDPKKIKKADLVAAIEKAGYKVEGEVLEVSVNGMACGACSSKVAKTLTSLKGVKSQEVCHESKKAKVVFCPKELTAKKVVAAINKTGFKVVQ